MHNFVFVQHTDGQHKLCGIELHSLLGESFDFEQICVEVAAPDVFEEEVDSVVVLEHVVHAQQEGVVGFQQDVTLIVRIIDLTFLNQ